MAIAIICVSVFVTNEQVAFATEENINVTSQSISLDAYVQDFQTKKDVSYGNSNAINRGTYFQNNLAYTYDSDAKLNACLIYGDDNITQLIPKELFTKSVEGKFHLSESYGYYIDSKLNADYHYYFCEVILFKTVANESGVRDYAVDLKVECVEQLSFYYIYSDNTYVSPYKLNESNTVSGNIFKYTFADGVTNAVVPALSVSVQSGQTLDRRFCEGHAGDVTDISFGAQVYNVNSYNQTDTQYSKDNDYGYFIIGNTYNYSATKYNEGVYQEMWKDIGITVVTAALGAFTPPLVSALVTIGSATYSITQSMISAQENFCYNVNNDNYYYSGLSLNNTRQTQKEAYGYLIKSSVVAINSTETEKVYFRNGDFARGEFDLSHTDRADNIKEYCRIRFDVGIKVNGQCAISEPLEYDINTPETKSVQAFENKTYYMVPCSHAYYTFTPAYSGTYTLNLGRTDLGVKVGSNVLTAENGVYSANLQANTAYTIDITNNTAEITTGSLYIDVGTASLPKTGSPQGRQTEILKIVPTSDGIYSLTTGTGGKIAGVKYLNNGLKNVVGAEEIYSGESDCIEVFLHANTAYYILVGNTDATNATSFNVNASSVSRTCTANSSTNLSLVANGNNKYFAITPSANGVTANITFSQLEGDNMYIFTVLDKNGALYNKFWYLSDGYLCINNLQTASAPYYIGVRANVNVNTVASLEYGDPEYAWEIYQGTTKLSWDNTPVVLTQGTTYTLHFVIQGEIVVTDLIIITSGVPTSEVSLDPQTGELTIATSARVDRVFAIGALNPGQSDMMFALPLTIKVGFNSD